MCPPYESLLDAFDRSGAVEHTLACYGEIGISGWLDTPPPPTFTNGEILDFIGLECLGEQKSLKR